PGVVAKRILLVGASVGGEPFAVAHLDAVSRWAGDLDGGPPRDHAADIQQDPIAIPPDDPKGECVDHPDGLLASMDEAAVRAHGEGGGIPSAVVEARAARSGHGMTRIERLAPVDVVVSGGSVAGPEALVRGEHLMRACLVVDDEPCEHAGFVGPGGPFPRPDVR